MVCSKYRTRWSRCAWPVGNRTHHRRPDREPSLSVPLPSPDWIGGLLPVRGVARLVPRPSMRHQNQALGSPWQRILQAPASHDFAQPGITGSLKSMKDRMPLALGMTATLLLAAWAIGQAAPSPSPAPAGRLKQGHYLVERVALCADCHTERDWKGKQDRRRWLQGSKLPFKPSRLMPWAEVAPPIAGLPSFTNPEQAVKYLETGLRLDGKQPSPPMPQYRLSHSDALAVVAYLQSLKVPSKGTTK